MSSESSPLGEPRWLTYVDRVSLVLAACGGIGLIGLMFNVVVSVLARSITGVSLLGTLDLSTYVWMPILTTLGMGYALQTSAHIRVSLITGAASPRAKRLVEIVSLALTGIVLVLLVYFTFTAGFSAAARGEAPPSSRWLQIWPMRFVVAIGLLGFLTQTVAELARAIRGGGASEDEVGQERFDEGEEVLL